MGQTKLKSNTNAAVVFCAEVQFTDGESKSLYGLAERKGISLSMSEFVD